MEDFNREIEDFNIDETECEEAERSSARKSAAVTSDVAEQAAGGEKEIPVWKEILSWILTFAAAFVVAMLIKNYVIINADVPTGSMENTIMPGDRLIGSRLAYRHDEPDRGDIIVFRYPDDETTLYVKRVIGLPGETVVIEDGRIYIDGAEEPLEETYLKEEWTVSTGPYTFEVPEGCYLVLGDNRNDSWDARYWKNTYVSGEKILGKALFIYWPISDFGSLK